MVGPSEHSQGGNECTSLNSFLWLLLFLSSCFMSFNIRASALNSQTCTFIFSHRYNFTSSFAIEEGLRVRACQGDQISWDLIHEFGG